MTEINRKPPNVAATIGRSTANFGKLADGAAEVAPVPRAVEHVAQMARQLKIVELERDSIGKSKRPTMITRLKIVEVGRDSIRESTQILSAPRVEGIGYGSHYKAEIITN